MRLVTRIHGTYPRIEQRTFFQQTHRFGHHIQRAFARLQHSLARFDNGVERINVALLLLRTELCTGNSPGAAMNCDYRINHFASPVSLHGGFFYKYHYR